MEKTKRALRVAVALVVAVCMVVSCTAGAYAEVITMTLVTSAVLVSAILTACGLIIESGNPEVWENLCNAVAEIAQLPAKVSLAVFGGITYVERAIIDAVVRAANEQQAFEPTQEIQYATVGGYTFPYIGEHTELSGSLGDAKMRPLASYFNWVDVPAFSYPFENFSIPINDRISVHWEWTFYSSGSKYLGWYYYLDDIYLYGMGSQTGMGTNQPDSGTVGARKMSNVVVSSYGSTYYYLISYYSYSNELYYGLQSQIKGEAPSISTDFPWQLDPDGHAGIDEDGQVALPGAWPEAGAVIGGVASLPISVPANTVIGAADQAPSDARTGTGTKVEVDDPPITDDKVKDAVEQRKLSLSIIDYFPFCIPFDLVKGVKLLQAPVEEPIFDVPIQVPYLGEQTLHVDLTEWDGVFVITRWFLLLGFVAGLALVTSKVIKW